MTDPKIVAQTYLATWNAAPDRRRTALAAWSPDATYIDPLMSARGHEGLARMIDSAIGQFPGHSFELEGTPDGYGRFVRFSWTVRDSTRVVAARGTDVIKLDDDGRITEVIGFLDGGPA